MMIQVALITILYCIIENTVIWKICLTQCPVNQYMPNEWFLALCVCMNTCVCMDKRTIHDAMQMIDTLVRQGGKHCVMVYSPQYKKFYNDLNRLLFSSLSNLKEKSLWEPDFLHVVQWKQHIATVPVQNHIEEPSCLLLSQTFRKARVSSFKLPGFLASIFCFQKHISFPIQMFM